MWKTHAFFPICLYVLNPCPRRTWNNHTEKKQLTFNLPMEVLAGEDRRSHHKSQTPPKKCIIVDICWLLIDHYFSRIVFSIVFFWLLIRGNNRYKRKNHLEQGGTTSNFFWRHFILSAKSTFVSYNLWLVVSTPLKNMKVSWDDYS